MLRLGTAMILAALGDAVSPSAAPWGHTPFFGSSSAFEVSDRLLQRQLEQYGSDLSDAVNKLRDMANVARSESLRASILAKVEQTVGCWQDNLQVLESSLLRTFPRAPAIGDSSCSLGHGGCGNRADSIPLPPGWDSAPGLASYNKSGYDDIYQVFHHVVRDWSAQGAEIRRQLYDPLVSRLVAEQAGHSEPNNNGDRQRLQVLVPGSGLGRLAYELARADLSVTGVEVSTVMLSVSFVLFNQPAAVLAPTQQLQLYPFLHDDYTNELSSQDRYGSVLVPDVNVSSARVAESKTQHLSFLQADFIDMFSPSSSRSADDREMRDSPHLAHFDAVVTCFLVDAVNHVEDAVHAIRTALRPGGLWLNCGPLQWHENSVLHLALDELLQVVRDAGFEVTETEYLEPVPYRSGRDSVRSTRPLLYRPVMWAARKL
jgi:carnosine N-methyltransferase